MQEYRQVLARAEQLMRAGDYQAALAILEFLLPRHPNVVALHWYRSRCLVRLGQRDKARIALTAVLRARPNFVPALMIRVKLARDDAEDFDVEPLLRRILLLEPERARAMYWLADTLLQRGPEHQREALQLLDQSIALSPDLLKARLRRADLLIAQSEDPEQLPQDAQLHTDALGVGLDRRKLEAALVDLQYVADRRHHEKADIRAAHILLRLGRQQEALGHFDRMLARLASNDPRRAALQLLRQQALQRPLPDAGFTISGGATASAPDHGMGNATGNAQAAAQ